jgi:protein phosphatase
MSGKKVRLFHASQKGVYYRIFHNEPQEKHLSMFNNTDFTGYLFEPNVIGYADIHYPYNRTYNEKILFNTGSVGNPLDKPLASYTILEGNYNSTEDGVFSIEIIRLPYDIELAVKQARDSKMPDFTPYEIELRTARYRNIK